MESEKIIDRKDFYKDKFSYLIISPSYFAKTLERLAEHKKQLNIKTNIITLNKIYKNYFFEINANDGAEKIKFFIKKVYDKCNIKFVLLIGGKKHFPVRYAYNSDYYEKKNLKEEKFISDLYYSDLYDSKNNFSTWNSNKNKKYAEWHGKEAQDKEIDLKPNICVGRIPCNNIFELRHQVKKIIYYENNTYGKDWFNNIIGIGGNTYYDKGDVFEGEVDIKNSFEKLEEFNKIEFLVSDETLEKKGITGFINQINKGCGFLVFAGHGSPLQYHTYKYDDEQIGIFSKYHMRYLKNKNKYPICISNGCNNSKFDTTPLNIFKNGKDSLIKNDFCLNCWSWVLTRKKNSGSIATIGSTGFTYNKWDEKCNGESDAWSFILPKFFELYDNDKNKKLGEIFSDLIKNYLNSFSINWDTPSIDYKNSLPAPDAVNAKTVQEMILFGDPSLKIGGYKRERFI